MQPSPAAVRPPSERLPDYADSKCLSFITSVGAANSVGIIRDSA